MPIPLRTTNSAGAAIAALAIAGVLGLRVACRQPAPASKRRLRPESASRTRYTPRLRPDPPGTVGVMVAFTPAAQPPDGGWSIEQKISIGQAPAWLFSPDLPLVIDRQFGTIGVPLLPRHRTARLGAPPPAAAGPTAATRSRVNVFAARGMARIADLPRLRERLSQEGDFQGLFHDAPIMLDAENESCLLPPEGTADGVVAASAQATIQGPRDVLLAIVDSGFSRLMVQAAAPNAKFNRALSFPQVTGSGEPGSDPGDGHGNMCAYDAALVGGFATFVDIRTADPLKMRLSDAEAAYNFLLNQLIAHPELKTQYNGLVISNSWGLWSPDRDLPAVERYFDNINHPFTKLVQRLAEAGADIVFAAGDAAVCPAAPGETGTIWAANSLPEVISVAAVDVNKARISYSAQGPGIFEPNKPDVSAYSHFVGANGGGRDTGTSASAAVVAGIVAAIRSQQGWSWTQKTPAELKQRLQSDADREVMQGGVPLTLTGWSRDFGFGIARLR